MAWLEHRVPPPVWTLLFLLLMAALAYLTPPLAAPLWLRIAGGLAIALPGGIAAAWGARTFHHAGANFSPLDIERGETLVTGGVYKYTRNPMYLGLLLVLCGFAFFLARPVEIVPVVLFALLLTRVQIQPEERAMRAKFGSAYEDYARSTRRWI